MQTGREGCWEHMFIKVRERKERKRGEKNAVKFQKRSVRTSVLSTDFQPASSTLHFPGTKVQRSESPKEAMVKVTCQAGCERACVCVCASLCV